jgi:hypothetical protein
MSGSGAVRYNPDDTITKKYRGVCDVSFSAVSDEAPLHPMATVLSYASWIVLVIKLSYCALVFVVLVVNLCGVEVGWDMVQGVAPTKEQNSLHNVILEVYFVNYGRWIAFTLGPRLLHIRLQRYRDLLIKIPNLRHTIKNVLLFIVSDLFNFNMLSAVLIIIGSRGAGTSHESIALPAAYIFLQYLFPPHMIKAIFEPHVKEFVVRPSILAYDCSYCPYTCFDCAKVFMVDFILNWLNFYLWICYWLFLIVGFLFVYMPVVVCGYLKLCCQNRPILRTFLYVLFVVPLLSVSVVLCCFGEVLSGRAFSLLLTLSVLLIEHELVETSQVLVYFPDITRRLQPAASASVDHLDSSYLTSSLIN